MGAKISKDVLNIKSFNLDKVYESIITSNIISNIINYNHDCYFIICLQGLRNFNNYKDYIYYDINLGLYFYTNCNVTNYDIQYFTSNKFNRLSYGFQYISINYKNIEIGIINIDIIENHINLYNYDEVKKNQIDNMINYLKKKKTKINLITNFNYLSLDYNLINLNKLFDNDINLNNNKFYLFINDSQYNIDKKEIKLRSNIFNTIGKKIHFINSLNKNGIEFITKIE